MLCKNLSNGVITRTTSVKAVHTHAVQAVQAVCVFLKNYLIATRFLNHTFVMYSTAPRSNSFMKEL